jgi:Flp pilus assembly protein TadD
MAKGWMDEALAASKWTLEQNTNAAMEVTVLERLASLYGSMGETQSFLDVSRRLVQIRPDDPRALNNLFYLEALLDAPSDGGPERFARLVETWPDEIFRSGYAFALWRAGEFERAQEQFNLLNERFLEVPVCRLNGALIAFDNQDRSRARQLLSTVEPDQLLPEEAELFEELTARLED